MSEWRPIETFNYEAERQRQGSIFPYVIAWAPGRRVQPISYWGGEWHDIDVGEQYDGDPLGWEPTHWRPLPDPPAV